jgi:hypothetical protein
LRKNAALAGDLTPDRFANHERYTVKKNLARGLALALLACLLVPLAQAKKQPETWDGLNLKKVKGLDAVYVRPDVQFTPYKSVMLDKVEVEFAKNWAKDVNNSGSPGFKNKPTAEDMQEIKDGLAELMHEVFLQELTKHGYTVVDTAADDTLHVRTAIIDLWVNAPETSDPGMTRTYTTSSGSMTLVLEARDGPTGQLLARVVDGRSDETAAGQFQWTTKASNTNAARRILQDWARKLRESLDRLNGKE